MQSNPIKEATTAIVTLINSRATSPRPDEIEAIVARAVSAPVSTSLPDHVVAYRAKTQEFYLHAKHVLGPMAFEDPHYAAEEARGAELSDQADTAGEVVIATHPTTWGDLIGLAYIIASEAGHDLDALGPRRTTQGDPADRAAEVLALAILQLHSSVFPQMVPVEIELPPALLKGGRSHG